MARNLMPFSGRVTHEKTPNLLKSISLAKIYLKNLTMSNFIVCMSNLTVKNPEDVPKLT